jgi:hypothetical protein
MRVSCICLAGYSAVYFLFLGVRRMAGNNAVYFLLLGVGRMALDAAGSEGFSLLSHKAHYRLITNNALQL